jgi:hypothetical protein
VPLSEFDPAETLRVLERHDVRYVVIGAIAAIAAGAPLVTRGLDIAPKRDAENLVRLARALDELDAPVEPEMLTSANIWTLTTQTGQLGVVFEPAGTRGFEDLRRDATQVELAPGVTVLVASLADVIRSKEATARTKDLGQLPLLRQTLERLRS